MGQVLTNVRNGMADCLEGMAAFLRVDQPPLANQAKAAIAAEGAALTGSTPPPSYLMDAVRQARGSSEESILMEVRQRLLQDVQDANQSPGFSDEEILNAIRSRNDTGGQVQEEGDETTTSSSSPPCVRNPFH